MFKAKLRRVINCKKNCNLILDKSDQNRLFFAYFCHHQSQTWQETDDSSSFYIADDVFYVKSYAKMFVKHE